MEQPTVDTTESSAIAQLVRFLAEDFTPCVDCRNNDVKTTFVNGINPWTGESNAKSDD